MKNGIMKWFIFNVEETSIIRKPNFIFQTLINIIKTLTRKKFQNWFEAILNNFKHYFKQF